MKTFKFADATTLEADDVSTVNEIVVTIPVTDAGTVFTQVSPDNLKAVSIDDGPSEEVVFERAEVTRDGDNLNIHFFSRYLTDAEVLKRKVADLEDAVTALTE